MKTTQRSAGRGAIGVRGTLLAMALGLAAGPASAATPLLKFDFDEGTGFELTDKANSLKATLGPALDPANNPLVIADTPSKGATDKAVSLNVGNDAGQGFLVVDDRSGPLLAFSTNTFTMEAWINVDPADTRVYEGIGAYGSSYKMGLNNGELLFTLFGIVDIPSGLLVPHGEWHHVAVVWNAGVGATFYLDGGSETFVAETRLPRAFGNNYLTIGAEGVGGTTIMSAIDRFRVHASALTPAELDSVPATAKAPLPTTVVSYEFSESAPPFKNSAPANRPAFTSNEYLALATRPVFITNSPSQKAGDFALQIAAGQKAIGDDSGLAISLDQADSSFTIQSWVKFGAQPGGRSVIWFNNGPGGAISFSVTSDRRVFVTTLGILDAPSDAFVPDDGGWHHIAVVHQNGKELRYYVDGVLGFTRAYTSGVIFTRTDPTFTIGSEPNGALQFVGAIDRLQVTAGALPADQLDYYLVPGVPPANPSVSIETAVQVSWPTIPAGFSLQRSLDVGEPKNWTTVTNKPSVGTGSYYLLFPTTSTKVFYRLVKP